MLKIRSFLRQTKDCLKNFIKKMLQRYSKHMAVTAYGLSAVILVFQFGNLANITVSASNQFEAATNYETVNTKSEGTHASELLWSDNTEYALISPDNHIIQLITETVDELPADMLHHVITNKTPLGQQSISPVASAKYYAAASMAILTSQEELLLTTEAKELVLETMALGKENLLGNVNSTESKVETTNEMTSVTPSNEEIKKEALDEETKSYEEFSKEALDEETLSNELVSSETGKVEKGNKEDKDKNKNKDKNKDTEKEVSKQEKDKDGVKGKDNEAIETLSMADVSVPSNLTLNRNKAMKLSLSEKELEVLWRIVEAEATGEDIYGKILVANVVINRVNSKDFPDTITEVVFQKSGGTYQFSPTRDGRFWSVKVSKKTIQAVERALSGEDYSEGALYFFARRLTTDKKANWFDDALERVVQYGCHEFYAD